MWLVQPVWGNGRGSRFQGPGPSLQHLLLAHGVLARRQLEDLALGEGAQVHARVQLLHVLEIDATLADDVPVATEETKNKNTAVSTSDTGTGNGEQRWCELNGVMPAEQCCPFMMLTHAGRVWAVLVEVETRH